MDVKETISKIQKNLEPQGYFDDIFHSRDNHLFYKKINLSDYKKVHLLGIGKSSSFEVLSFKNYIKESSENLSLGLIMTITKKGFAVDDNFIQYENSHPNVTNENILNSKDFVSKCSEISSSDLVVFFLSGGASALFEIPKEGISNDYLIQRNRELIESELSINEINEKRKELSRVKNGGLLNYLPTKHIIQLITCDIANGNISDVGSGPLIQFAGETKVFSEVYRSADKLISKIESTSTDIGKIYNCSLSDMIADLMEHLPSKGRVHISGGEATLKLPIKRGRGGRNTHFVLSMAHTLYNVHTNRDIEILSFATDGDDGDTECAGAYINWELYQKIDAKKYLAEFDSYHYFKEIESLIRVDATKSNVMDIRYIWRRGT